MILKIKQWLETKGHQFIPGPDMMHAMRLSDCSWFNTSDIISFYDKSMVNGQIICFYDDCIHVLVKPLTNFGTSLVEINSIKLVYKSLDASSRKKYSSQIKLFNNDTKG